jgi:hypothetical protein
LRVAAGEGELAAWKGQLVQPGEEVVGVGTGDIEADEEADAAVAVQQLREALAQLAVALGGFGDEQLRGGLLQVLVEEGGVVAVACGVDADADRSGRRIGSGGCVLGRRAQRGRLARGVGSW